MTITTLPTRDAADLGAALSNVRSPVANELSAVNLEKIKDWIISLASEVGKTDGSTVGSLREAVNALSAGGGAGELLFDMPIATGSVAAGAAASWARSDNDLPATPTGTASVSLVADPALPDRQCLRVGATTSAEGIWMFALQNVTLPAEGYVLEVDIAALPDVSTAVARAVIGVMYEDYALGGARSSPRGFFVYAYQGASNVELTSARLETTNYTREEWLASFTTPGTMHDTAADEAGGIQLRIEVRRVNATTPYQYLIRVDIRDSGGVARSSKSYVATPGNADIDGKTFVKIGLGGFVDTSAGPAGDAWISVRALRVYRL